MPPKKYKRLQDYGINGYVLDDEKRWVSLGDYYSIPLAKYKRLPVESKRAFAHYIDELIEGNLPFETPAAERAALAFANTDIFGYLEDYLDESQWDHDPTKPPVGYQVPKEAPPAPPRRLGLGPKTTTTPVTPTKRPAETPVAPVTPAKVAKTTDPTPSKTNIYTEYTGSSMVKRMPRMRRTMRRRRMMRRRRGPYRRKYKRGRVFRKTYTKMNGPFGKIQRKWGRKKRKIYYKFASKVESVILGESTAQTFEFAADFTPLDGTRAHEVTWRQITADATPIPKTWQNVSKAGFTVCLTNLTDKMMHMGLIVFVRKRNPNTQQGRFQESFTDKTRHIADDPKDLYFQSWMDGYVLRYVRTTAQPKQCLMIDVGGLPRRTKGDEHGQTCVYVSMKTCPFSIDKAEKIGSTNIFGKMYGRQSAVKPKIATSILDYMTKMTPAEAI